MRNCATPARYNVRSLLRLVALTVLAVLFLVLVSGRNREDALELIEMTHKDDFIAAYDAEDPRLIQHMREHYIDFPNWKTPRKLDHPEIKDPSQYGQSRLVSRLLGERRNGVFLEVGAYDGETLANTLYFERYLNWTGLLIEADPANLALLRRRNRKSFVVKGCIGDNAKHPVKRSFFGASEVGGLTEDIGALRKLLTRIWRTSRQVEVWCFPMTSILKAVKIDRIDYAVIDVEGSEMAVLKALDLSKVDIEILQVEYAIFQGAFWDKGRSQERKVEMETYVKTSMKGYEVVDYIGLDIIIRKHYTPAPIH